MSRNALEDEKPQRLLNNALAFYEAGRRCATLSKTSFPPHKEAHLGAPTVVCLAFAIEQFLKLLLLLETGGYPSREHALDTLFDKLPSRVQQRIDANFGSWEGAARECLADARNAFVEWRYPHEKQFLAASDESLAKLGLTLRKTVREVRPELISVFEATLGPEDTPPVAG
jgi:hypothetical protein